VLNDSLKKRSVRLLPTRTTSATHKCDEMQDAGCYAHLILSRAASQRIVTSCTSRVVDPSRRLTFATT